MVHLKDISQAVLFAKRWDLSSQEKSQLMDLTFPKSNGHVRPLRLTQAHMSRSVFKLKRQNIDVSLGIQSKIYVHHQTAFD